MSDDRDPCDSTPAQADRRDYRPVWRCEHCGTIHETYPDRCESCGHDAFQTIEQWSG